MTEQDVDTLQTKHRINPLHAIVLGFPVALFTTSVATDITFLNTSEMQWSNFSSWLIAGGLVFGGIALLGAIWIAVRFVARPWRGRPLTHLALLGGMWIVGFVNALLHSRDAWYSVTATGAFLSAVTALLAGAAAWIAHGGFASGETRR